MTSNNWKYYTLKELVEIKYGRNQKDVASKLGDYPIFGTGGLMGYATKYLYDKPSVLIGRKGTINKVKYVKQPFWTVDTLFYTVINTEIVNSKFLYYLMSLLDLDNYNEGTTIPSLRTETLYRLEFKIPPLETQQKIAKVLSAIDDKIELNNSINNNLEQQAQAIFKSWFVDFEPFNGIIPDDWSEDILGNFIEIKRGGSPRPIQDYIADSGYRWLKISDATSIQSPFILNIKEHIKESGINKTVLLKSGSLVLSNSATPGIPKILDVDSCIHDGWLYFPKSMLSNEYLYLLFKFIRPNLVALGNGSVFTNLKTDILRNYNTILPDKETLTKFDGVVSAIFKQILYNTRENEKLIQLRDTLLPKLMSGEIDVSKVDISTDKLLFSEEKYVNE